MKELRTIREKAQAVLDDKKSTKKEKELAQLVLNLDSALVISMAQRTHWLSAFADAHDISKSEGLKTLGKEDALIKQFLRR